MRRLWGWAAVAAGAGAFGLCVLFGVGGVAGSRPAAPATPATVAAAHGVAVAPPLAAVSSRAEQPFPIPVVELRGSGADLGAGHGHRLAEQIRLLHKAYLGRFIRSDLERFLALKAAEAFESRLTPDYQDEVTALAKECGLDGREAMLGQCFLDLTAMTACSTITLPPDAAPDGVGRFGRNLDFPSLNVADKYTTLFVYHPAGKYAFASVGWPGLIGVLSGMNEHGLSVANMEVSRTPRLPQALPYTLLYRSILEQCRTTDEAIALLEKTPRQTSNNLMIMDAAGNRAVAEISPDGVTVRRPDEADRFGLISTNHRRDQDASTPGRCRRYDVLRADSEQDFGRIDVRQLESMLSAASQGKQTLQSMVFEPSNRVLYLSAGLDAARGTFHRIDLTPYFQR